ncbi:MAG: hypothetical protein AAGU18_11005 [Proteiniphilum sp.]
MTELEKNQMKMRLLDTLEEFVSDELEQNSFSCTTSTPLYMAQAAFAVIEQSIESNEVCES